MDWAERWRLWLLLLIPLLALRGWQGRARRARSWLAMGQMGTPPGVGSFAWLAALTCVILALAQPRWGRSPRPPLPPGRDLVLAMDVSRSMGAEDAVPDRLGLAVATAERLVRSLGAEVGRGDRVAVVAFSGQGVLRCPLTENLGAVVEALRSLRPGGVVQGGTDLAAAMESAIEAFDDQDHQDGRTVILFSDGEDHGERWRSVVDRIKERGVVVHAVAVGDPEQPHPVPLRPRSGVSSDVLFHEGEPVGSRRNDEGLKLIARETGGAFVPLGLATTDLGALYLDQIEPTARAGRDRVALVERPERFGLGLLGGMILALIASRPGALSRASRRRPSPFLTASLLALLVAGTGSDSAPRGAPELVARGRSAFSDGRFEEALGALNAAVAVDPASPWTRFGRAAALYQLGQFEKAREDYLIARGGADDGLRPRIDYGLGNTAAAMGELSKAVSHFDACLASTAPGPALDEVRRRAEGNRRFIRDGIRHDESPNEKDPGPSPGSPPRPDRKPSPPDSREPGDNAAAIAPTTQPDTPAGSVRPGKGGGGGTGPAQESGTPEERLVEALEHVREARRRRVDAPSIDAPLENIKDW